MLRCLILAGPLLVWLTVTAAAGPWPREKGRVFLSLSGQLHERDEFGIIDQFFGLYAEYGVTDRLTLGIDAGGDAVRMSKALAFLRWPLGAPERPLKFAIELGAGEVESEAALRPGLSVGRGITLWDRPGWMTGDARMILANSGDISLESDVTIGLDTGPRSKTIVQIQTGRPAHGRSYIRIAPSFVYRTGQGSFLEFGLIEPLSGTDRRAVKLGLWREF